MDVYTELKLSRFANRIVAHKNFAHKSVQITTFHAKHYWAGEVLLPWVGTYNSITSLWCNLASRHVHGSRKRIPGCDPKDLDPGSVRIITRSTLTVCRQIHWDHRSAIAIWQGIHSDPRTNTGYCVGIQRDPISDKRNSCIFYALLRDEQHFPLNYNSNMHCHMILLIFYPEIAQLNPGICERSAWIHDFLRS